MQEKVILTPSLEGTDYLKSLAAFNKDPKLTFGVRYFHSLELAKYLMQLNGVSCDKKFITDVVLAAKLYKLVKNIPYFEKSSFEDVHNLLKSVNDLRRCIPFDEGKEIEDKLPKDLFKKKNEAIISFYHLMVNLINEENIIDEIGLIRYAMDKCEPVGQIEFVRYEEFVYTNLDIALINKAAGKEVKPSSFVGEHKEKISSYTKAFGQTNEIENILNYIYKNNIKFDECVIVASDVNTYGKILSNYQATLKFPLVVNSGQPISDTSAGRLFASLCTWIGMHNHVDYLKAVLFSQEFNLEQFKKDIDLPENFDDVNNELKLSYRDRISFDSIIETVGNLRLGFDSFDSNDERFNAYKSLLLERKAEAPLDTKVRRDLVIYDYVEIIKSIFDRGLLEFLSRYTLINHDNESVELHALDKYLLVLSLAITYELPFFEVKKFLSNVVVGSRKPQPGSLYLTSIDTAMSFLRKHLFVVGLDSKSFPGKVAEDPNIFDRDYEAFGVHKASSRKMNENKLNYHNLIEYASSLDADIHLSYAYYNSETIKEQNASSVLFETYKKENGEDKTVGDFNNEFVENTKKYQKVGFFSSDLFPLSKIGEEAKNNVLVVPHKLDVSILENESALDLISKRGLSATAISKYIDCPYEFFLSVVLGIEQEKDTNIYEIIPANDIGTLAHELMENFSLEMSKKEFLELSEKKFKEYLIMHPSDNPQAEDEHLADFLFMMSNGYDMEKKENQPSVLREEDLLAIHEPTQLRIHGFPDKVVKLSDGTYRVEDYKTGNNVKHDVDKVETMIQGAHYAYLLEHGKNKLNNYGRKKIKVSEFVFHYLKSKQSISSYDYDHKIDEYMEYLDEILTQIKESLDTGEFPQSGKCETCFFRDVCGGKKDEEN